ncbi:MAG: carboxypeptidase-like regulatory domain-containing protein [Vicinamibacterales bacterium]
MRSRYAFAWAAVRLVAFTGLASIPVCGQAFAGRDEPGTVRGVVWNTDNSPVANARVRLRNLDSGRVVSTNEASGIGQFVFEAVARGSYLVELVSDNGKVVAVGPSFRVGPRETVSTIVRLPSRRSWYASMFSNAAAGVIAAASSVGLTAIGTDARPISPQ